MLGIFVVGKWSRMARNQQKIIGIISLTLIGKPEQKNDS